MRLRRSLRAEKAPRATAPSRGRSKVWVYVCVAAVCIGITGCDSGSGAPISLAGLTCIDAQGDNSTAQEIATVGLNGPKWAPFANKYGTNADYYRQRLEEVGPGSPLASSYKDDLDPGMGAMEVFDTVPPGGDAAFASKVCPLIPKWSGAGIYPFGFAKEDQKPLREEPHWLRHFGRTMCEAVASDFDQDAERYLDSQGAALAKFRADPRAYIDEQLAQLAAVIAESPPPKDDNEKFFLAYAEAKQEVYLAARENPDLIGDELQVGFDVHKFAIENQCPQFTDFGVSGPDGCGKITYPNSRDMQGVVRIKIGTMSCDDAVAMVDNHIAEVMNIPTGRLDPTSPLAEFECRTAGFAVTDDEPYYTSCVHPIKDGLVVVTPIG